MSQMVHLKTCFLTEKYIFSKGRILWNPKVPNMHVKASNKNCMHIESQFKPKQNFCVHFTKPKSENDVSKMYKMLEKMSISQTLATLSGNFQYPNNGRQKSYFHDLIRHCPRKRHTVYWKKSSIAPST